MNRPPLKNKYNKIGAPPHYAPLGKSICNHPVLEKWVRQLPFMLKCYSFQKYVGSGSFSVIFKVHHRGYDRNFAAKVVPEQLLCREGTNNTGFVETEVLQQLNHKNIIRLYDHFIDSGCIVLILELCIKGTLRQLIGSQNNLSYNEAIPIMSDILSAIEYCHTRGIAHRDLKPGNIFIDDNNRPLLADFGNSYIMPKNGLESIDNVLITDYNGTLMYRAPEVISETPFNPFKADIWSLGLTFYVMITGSEPWDTFSIDAIRNSIIRANVTFPTDTNEVLMKIIMSMLSLDPNNRPSAMELLASPIFKDSEQPNRFRHRSGSVPRSNLLATTMVVSRNRKLSFGLNSSLPKNES